MTETFRVLIVDDEPLARTGLRRLVEARPDCEVIGEARDGVEALGAIEALRPDLVLLDIEMPAMGAFEVLAALGPREVPAIVLVTAYDEYGVEAFDAGAIDYVLKPVDSLRLAKAMERALRQVRGARSSSVEPEPVWLVRIITKLAGRTQVVPVDQIIWLEAHGSYVKIHTQAGEFLHRTSLTRLEQELDPRNFARIHRSTLVAVREIDALEPAGHGDATLTLRSGIKLAVSRSYRPGLLV